MNSPSESRRITPIKCPQSKTYYSLNVRIIDISLSNTSCHYFPLHPACWLFLGQASIQVREMNTGKITLNLLSNKSINKANRNLILQIHHRLLQGVLINCSVSLKALYSNWYIKLFVGVIFTFLSSEEGQGLNGRWCGIQNVLMCNNITITQRWFRIRMRVHIG